MFQAQLTESVHFFKKLLAKSIKMFSMKKNLQFHRSNIIPICGNILCILILGLFDLDKEQIIL